MTRIAALLAVAIVSVGCAGGADLASFGRTEVTVKMQSAEAHKGADLPDNVYRCGMPLGEATYLSGKEVGRLTLERKADCSLIVTADDVEAFPGQQFAADVAKVQVETQGGAVKAIADILTPDGIKALVEFVRAFKGG